MVADESVLVYHPLTRGMKAGSGYVIMYQNISRFLINMNDDDE